MKKVFILLLIACTYALATPQKAIKLNYDSIPVLILKGSDDEMGYAYGFLLKKDLEKVLSILKKFYIEKKHLSYSDLVHQGERLYQRFPTHFQLFLKGVSRGSALSFQDIKIINAMETLGELLPNHHGDCSFLFLPNTKTHVPFIGRNYDYPPPFDELARYLTITILNKKDSIPTAFISLAGEVYCPTCINKKNIFMELNNGMASGGYTINYNNPSLLTHMLTTLQHSNSLSDVEKNMKDFNPDYSLIINVSDKKEVESFEFPTNPSLRMKFFMNEKNHPFISTNFFLNSAWKDSITHPTDSDTYFALTRRNNLIALSHSLTQCDLNCFEQVMDRTIHNKGAKGKLTIYQLIFNPDTSFLYVKNNSLTHWVSIPLGELFKNSSV